VLTSGLTILPCPPTTWPPSGPATAVFRKVVNNEGIISAGKIEKKGGRIRLVGLGSGSSVINTGTIQAAAGTSTDDGGTIEIVAENIENIGELNANSTGGQGGVINLESTGTTLLTGTSIVTATSDNAAGGTVQILGDKVGLFDNATIDASGASAGGEVLIGGDYQGSNPDVQNASHTFVSSNALITVDAITAGDGGKVIVWSDGITDFRGYISARGGQLDGDGGFIEVSGKGYLNYRGLVDTRAPQGETGTLLLDPTTIEIRGGAGDGDGDTNTTTFTGSGGAIQAAGIIAFDNTDTFIFESEIEGQSTTTDIILSATIDITVGVNATEDLTGVLIEDAI